MVRTELVEALGAQHPKLRAREAEKIVTAFFDIIAERLASGGRIEIRGFGSFTTCARDARIGRNPRTGEVVSVAATRTVYFRPGKELRELIDVSSAQV